MPNLRAEKEGLLSQLMTLCEKVCLVCALPFLSATSTLTPIFPLVATGARSQEWNIVKVGLGGSLMNRAFRRHIYRNCGICFALRQVGYPSAGSHPSTIQQLPTVPHLSRVHVRRVNIGQYVIARPHAFPNRRDIPSNSRKMVYESCHSIRDKRATSNERLGPQFCKQINRTSDRCICSAVTFYCALCFASQCCRA